jgi:hypothetical protein
MTDNKDISYHSRGGHARAMSLSQSNRMAIAKKAAMARWGSKATHKGSFKEEFGIDVDCYVLDDPSKTAVISQRGMGTALGLGVSGSRLPMFVNSKRMAAHVGQELREKLENPLIFQAPSAGGNSPPPSKVNGYDVTILIDICKAVVAAEAAGQTVNPAVVKQAHVILTASAKAGIKDLVYALAGYSPSTEDVVSAFKLYVQEEAKKYEPEFPNELYMQWHRLYDIPVPVRGKPWHFKYLTVNHIYHPLAQSSGKIYILLKALKAKDGNNQRSKLFQFLNEIGARALRIHLGRVLEMAESSGDSFTYEKRIVERFGGQQELALIIPAPSNVSQRPAEQSESVGQQLELGL